MGITIDVFPVWQEGHEPPLQRQTPWVDTGEMDRHIDAICMIPESQFVRRLRTRYLVRLIDAAFREFRHLYVVIEGALTASVLLSVIAHYTNSAFGPDEGVFQDDRVPIMMRSATSDLQFYQNLQLMKPDELGRLTYFGEELGVFPEVCIFLAQHYAEGNGRPDVALARLISYKDAKKESEDGNDSEDKDKDEYESE